MVHLFLFYSPAIVDDTCNFDVVGQRIAWGKLVNAGQVSSPSTSSIVSVLRANRNYKMTFETVIRNFELY